MKALFFNPEQYVDWKNEPSNIQLRLPLLATRAITEHEDFVYQRVLKEDGKLAMNSEALARYNEFQPDIVINSLAWWPECLDWQTLRDIRSAGGCVVTVFWDTWLSTLPHEIELLLNSDVTIVMDSLTNYLKFRLLLEQQGSPNRVGFAPIAVHTPLVKPMGLEKTCDVLLLGSQEGQRVELAKFLTRELKERGISFSRAGGLVNEAVDGKMKTPWISWDEYVRTINSTKIAISSQTQPDRIQIKGKIFDYFACGTLCLSDDNSDLRAFVPDDCLVYYTDPQDCVEKATHYLSDDSAREKIAARGREWLNSVYDSSAFWRTMLRSSAMRGQTLPELKGVDEIYIRYRTNLGLISKSQLAGFDVLGQLLAAGQTATRLPCRAEGAYKGINIFAVDERWWVLCANVAIDFVEVDGKLHTVTPRAGLALLDDGANVRTTNERISVANSVAHARQLIDLMEIKGELTSP